MPNFTESDQMPTDKPKADESYQHGGMRIIKIKKNQILDRQNQLFPRHRNQSVAHLESEIS